MDIQQWLNDNRQQKADVLVECPVPSPLHPLQTLHGIKQDSIWDFDVESWKQAAWGVIRMSLSSNMKWTAVVTEKLQQHFRKLYPPLQLEICKKKSKTAMKGVRSQMRPLYDDSYWMSKKQTNYKPVLTTFATMK
jgi:hypothetical protein